MKPRICSAGTLVVLATACGGTPSQAMRPEPPRLAGTSCDASRTHLRPLIVDWAAGDRASVEAAARRQLLVVRYQGCELEVLRGCRTGGSYEYIALTPKRDQISMRDRNELEAKLPLGAANLGGELETSGELSLDMTTVGMLESSVSGVRVDQLEGECDGATHIVSALAVGAFELSSGSSARVGANAGAFGAGVAGESESTQRALSKDGELGECRAGGEGPQDRCRALLRLELLALGAHRPLCGDKERYNGESCEPLLIPVAISDDKRAALQRACKLGVKPACKAAEVVGQR
jgi:hypothetical protein